MPQKVTLDPVGISCELGDSLKGIKNVRVEMLGHGPSIGFSDDLCRLVVHKVAS